MATSALHLKCHRPVAISDILSLFISHDYCPIARQGIEGDKVGFKMFLRGGMARYIKTTDIFVLKTFSSDKGFMGSGVPWSTLLRTVWAWKIGTGGVD